MSVRVIFLGPPGAGKGTQAQSLAHEWGVPHIATGDMLREAVAAKTALGLEAKRHMDSGGLVPDDVVIGLVGERLAQPDAKAGCVLDGFPRTTAQAEALDAVFTRAGIALDRVVFFDVSRAETARPPWRRAWTSTRSRRRRSSTTTAAAGSSPRSRARDR